MTNLSSSPPRPQLDSVVLCHMRHSSHGYDVTQRGASGVYKHASLLLPSRITYSEAFNDRNTSSIDASTNQTHHTQMPSDIVPPTRSHSIPQQGSTQPGDGSEVRVVDKQTRDDLMNDPNINVVEVPNKKVPFKDQVVGYAQKTRGTLLGKTDVKQHGDEILEGRAPATQDLKHTN